MPGRVLDPAGHFDPDRTLDHVQNPSRGIRLLQALAAALLALSLVGASQAGPRGAAAAADCDGRRADGLVTLVTPPAFPAPPASFVDGRRGHLVDLAVDRFGGSVAWVTDGWSIARTDDAGCSWRIVHSLGDVADPTQVEPQTAAIVSLATPDAPGADGFLYALVQDLAVPSSSARFSVLVTTDAGRSFVRRGDGLAPVNLGADADACGDDTPCEILGTGDPSTVYLRFSGPDRTLVHRSTDQARTFEGRNAVTEFGGATPANGPAQAPPILTDLAVDPGEPNVLWGTSVASGPQRSETGGRAFVHYEPFERFVLPLTEIRHVEVVRFGGVRVVVVAGLDASRRERVALSGNDGEVFQEVGGALTGRVTGLVATDRLGVVAATDQGTVLVNGAKGATQLSSRAHAGLRSLQAVHTAGAAAFERADGRVVEPVWALNDREIVEFDVAEFRAPTFEDLGIPFDVGFDPLRIPDTTDGVLRGPTLVNLAVGQTLDLGYVLEVPAVPVAVDIFFLLDETGSMQEEFDALAGGIDRIATEIQASGIDVQVGLGTYGNGFRYHRYRQIGPVDDEFRTRLASIRAGGDGEVAYTGLREVILGTGLRRSTAGNGARSGQDARWRDGAIRMIVHATDEELKEEPEGPTRLEAIAALQAAKARHLGLIAFDASNATRVNADPTKPGDLEARPADWGPMFDLAARTGAVAPAGEGIDCDNDGFVDIQPGEPIACHLSPATTNRELSQADRIDLIPDFASVILAMVNAEGLTGSITPNRSPSRLVTAFASTERTNVYDLHEPVVFGAKARAVCTQALAGQQEGVTLTMTSGTRVLGGLALRVTCGVTDPSVAAAGTGAAVGLAAAPAPATPPIPVNAPAPGAAGQGVQSVASSNSFVPQAAAAAAQQEQQQYQTAGIGGPEARDQPDIAYEFSARRRSDPAPVATAFGAGALLAGASALARQRRRQHDVVPGRMTLRR